MTTNGTLLPRKAEKLAKAGLDRITVSLDALDDRTFQAMNDVDVPVEEVLNGIQAAERAGLSITLAAREDLPAVLSDHRRIEQVIVNLLHNAIKFTPPGGEIELSAEQENEFVQFSVTDNGIGIPADDIQRIFERFFKTDRARSEAGTGLGLAIARHLVEAHNGQIWADSVEGEGSTFYFILPVAESS